MVDLVHYLTSLLLFDIPLFYYRTNLGSLIASVLLLKIVSVIRYFFAMFICNCFWVILLSSFWDFCNFISNFLTNWITLFEESLSASVADCLAWFLEVFYIFTNAFTHTFSKRERSTVFYKYSISSLNWIVRHFLYFTLQFITKVMLILSSTSNRLESWSVNHTSLYENSESKIFKIV